MWLRPFGFIAIVTAVGCGNVATERAVTCSGGKAPQVLPNGGFDDSTPPWIQEPVAPPLLCGAPRITPFSGVSAGCLGSTDGTVQALSQSVPLPEGARTAKLAGQICIATADTAKVDHDVLQFELLDGTNVISAIGKTTNQQGVANCQFAAFELTAALTSDPVTATLRIRSTLDATMPTSFYLDALSLTVGCTP